MKRDLGEMDVKKNIEWVERTGSDEKESEKRRNVRASEPRNRILL